METAISSSLRLAAPLLLSLLAAATLHAHGCIDEHPESVTVSDGGWANFTCSINCSNTSLRWRLVSPAMRVVNDRFLPIKRLERIWGKRWGVVIQSVTEQSNSSDYESVTVHIVASSQMNGAVIQCGAIATRRNQDSFYSKFAVLQVEPPTEDNVRDEEATLPPSPPAH